MFGIVRCNDELFVNHVLIVAKQYLYYCRQKSSLPSIRVFDSKIKMIYQLETIISADGSSPLVPTRCLLSLVSNGDLILLFFIWE